MAAGGCPSARMMQSFGPRPPARARRPAATGAPAESALSHWPVQIMLVPPTAPFLKGADLLVLADCVPVAFPTLHRDFLQGKARHDGLPQVRQHRGLHRKVRADRAAVRHPQHHRGGHGGALLRGPARHRSKGPETGRCDHPHGRSGHQRARQNPRTPAGAGGLTVRASGRRPGCRPLPPRPRPGAPDSAPDSCLHAVSLQHLPRRVL
ncbi:MAG: hypothetical protein MZV70_68235 [Desulfobacterales bacterium]|nr:hypothetical protein [Desulfobacterales bacterium]